MDKRLAGESWGAFRGHGTSIEQHNSLAAHSNPCVALEPSAVVRQKACDTMLEGSGEEVGDHEAGSHILRPGTWHWWLWMACRLLCTCMGFGLFSRWVLQCHRLPFVKLVQKRGEEDRPSLVEATGCPGNRFQTQRCLCLFFPLLRTAPGV